MIIGRDWKGLKGLGLKTAAGGKIISNQLTVEFYRALLVQTYRTSFADFWINDIYVGLVFNYYFIIFSFLYLIGDCLFIMIINCIVVHCAREV